MRYEFRAYHKPSKQYIDLDLILNLLSGLPVRIPLIKEPKKIRIGSFEEEFRVQTILNVGDIFCNPDFIVEMYTGLKDSQDKKIYEGDIVKFTVWWFDGNEAHTELTGTIVYSNENMSFQLKGVKNKEWESHTGFNGCRDYYTPFSELTFDEADFEVIGNIHENPELLEQPEPKEGEEC